MNVSYYEESFLFAITAIVGKPVKVDMNTLRATRGKFAQVCVEISL